MNNLASFNYKSESSRYKYYYQRLQVYYQKPVTQVSTAVIFTITTIIFFAVFAIKPTLETIAELLKKIQQQEKILVQAEQKAAALATAQNQYMSIEADLPILLSAIPSDYQLRPLLKDIEAIAGQLSIPLNSIRIADIEYPQLQKTDKPLEIHFTISLDSSYSLSKKFFTALQQLPRFIAIDSLSIVRPSEKENRSQADQNILKTNIGCKVYYMPEEGESDETGR